MVDIYSYDMVPLSDFLAEYKELNTNNRFRPVAVGRYGIRTRESIYSKELAQDYSKNKLIYKDTLTVGMGSVQMDIGILTDDITYSVSPAYHTYRINGINCDYLRFCLQARNADMFERYKKRGSRQGKSIDLKAWLHYLIPVYEIDGQLQIVSTLHKIQSIIDDRMEVIREEVRDLMKYLEGGKKVQIDVDIQDETESSGYQDDGGGFDIRTYREKVLDYLAAHSDSPVLRKIQHMEQINASDLKELEHILWDELGTKEDYEKSTNIDNLAVFVRSLIGLSQDAINEKFGDFLNGNTLNAQQQEFVKAIINYVRENGDIRREDLIEKSPFDNYDILTLFGENITTVLTIVNVLHDSVNVAA